jgi:aspartate oxidase
MSDIVTATKKPRTRKPSFTTAQIIDALTKSRGMVYIAAKALQCSPRTISRRAETNKDVRTAIEASRGEVLDVAEVALMAAIQRQESWAIAFALRTIGRHRGYVERTEIAALPPEQVDAAIAREMARLAGSSKDANAGTVEGHAEPVNDSH